MYKDFLQGLILSTLVMSGTASANSAQPCDFNLSAQKAWIDKYSPTISCATNEIVLSLPRHDGNNGQLSLSYNTEGELSEKAVQIGNGFYHWVFNYHSAGTLASITYPSGAVAQYADSSSIDALNTDNHLASTPNIIPGSNVDPRYSSTALAALPLDTDENINRSAEILQDLLGINLLDEYEYFAAFAVLKIRGLVNGEISTYYAHFGPSMRLLALSNSEGDILREFVYQSNELAYEIRGNTLHVPLTPDAELSIENGEQSHKASRKPIVVSTSHRVLIETQPSKLSSNLKANLSLNLSNASFLKRKTQAKLNPRDSDNDGLPDLWEHLYFSTLDRDGRGDFDNDGRSDRIEFLRNSNPKLKLDGTRHRTTQSQLNALLHQI